MRKSIKNVYNYVTSYGFTYVINNKTSKINEDARAIIEETGNFNPPGRIDIDFESSIQTLYDYAKAAEKILPKLHILKGIGYVKFHVLVASGDLKTPDKDFSSKNSIEEAYKHALVGIAAKIVNTEQFNKFAEQVYAQTRIYSYNKILDEVKKSLPKETHVPVVRNEERSV